MENLSEKQKKFCEEYIIDFNATKAAIRAGYAENSARQQACEMLTKPNIQKYVALLQQEASRKAQITVDRILREIATIAFNDPRRAFSDKGNLLNIKEMPDDIAAAIQSIKITEEKKSRFDPDDESVSFIKEIKFWDKGKQLELLGRYQSLFNDKLNIGGQEDNPVVIKPAPELTPEQWAAAFKPK